MVNGKLAHFSGSVIVLSLSSEATVRSLNHPFGNGKVPVRSQPRVNMLVIASAAMANVRRIWRYAMAKEEQARAEKAQQGRQEASQKASFALSFLQWAHNLIRQFRACCQPTLVYL